MFPIYKDFGLLLKRALKSHLAPSQVFHVSEYWSRWPNTKRWSSSECLHFIAEVKTQSLQSNKNKSEQKISSLYYICCLWVDC